MADESEIPPLEDMTKTLKQVSAMGTGKVDMVTTDKSSVTSKNAKINATVHRKVAARSINPEKMNSSSDMDVLKTTDFLKPNFAPMPLPDTVSDVSDKKLESSSKGMFAGLKKGFLFHGSCKHSAKSPESHPCLNSAELQEKTSIERTEKESLPFICPKKEKSQTGLTLDEVQQAMLEAKGLLDNQEWITGDLLNKVEKNELLLKRFADPHFMSALHEFQKNPATAMEKYKGNQEMEKFLVEFCSLLGDHFTTLDKSSENVGTLKASDKIVSQQSTVKPEICGLSDTKDIGLINRPESVLTDASVGQCQKSTWKTPKIVELNNSTTVSCDSHTAKTYKGDQKLYIQECLQKDEATVKDILNDPQMMEILLDPKIRSLIQLIKTDPEKAHRAVAAADADFHTKIQLLVSKGLLHFST